MNICAQDEKYIHVYLNFTSKLWKTYWTWKHLLLKAFKYLKLLKSNHVWTLLLNYEKLTKIGSVCFLSNIAKLKRIHVWILLLNYEKLTEIGSVCFRKPFKYCKVEKNTCLNFTSKLWKTYWNWKQSFRKPFKYCKVEKDTCLNFTSKLWKT